jgi:hypothetical protein
MFLSKEIISKIKRNINTNNRKDIEKVGIEGTLTFDEYMERMREQGWKCYVCRQDFKFDGDKWCYFFPSADRIDNKKPHFKDNIAISCFFCNVRMFKQINEKKCGLCKQPEHSFEGKIPTKSMLFARLGHSDYAVREYLSDIRDLFIDKNKLKCLEVE